MDAVNVMKGYDKLNHHPPMHKRLRATVIISAVLLSLIIGLMLAVLIHESNTEEHKQLDAVESLKTVCGVTQNPDSCFTALSSLNISTTKPDPEVILKLSLQVNVKELANLTSLIKRLNDDNHPEVALRDCVDQLGDALSRINDSMSEIEGEKPTSDRTVNDIQTWVSAAMTDEETCLDGFEEMGSTMADEVVKRQIKKSKELLSYSLAIVVNLQNLLQKFGLTMH